MPVLVAARPDLGSGSAVPWFGSPLYLFLAVAGLVTVVSNAVAIWRVRIWNPSRDIQLRPAENEEDGRMEPQHLHDEQIDRCRRTLPYLIGLGLGDLLQKTTAVVGPVAQFTDNRFEQTLKAQL